VSLAASGERERLELVRAIAVLGDGAHLRHAAALARLSLEVAATAADELARREILMPGTPLRFANQAARSDVYRSIPVVLRGVRHAQAARMLADEAADPDAVCAHLLAAEATGSLDVVSRLESAAERARSRGRPDLAISYLSRALEETTDVDARRRVRDALGQAARVLRASDATRHMEAALELCDDADRRVAIANDIAEVRLFAGVREAARQAIDRSAPDEALQFVLDAYDTRSVQQADHRIDGLMTTARASARPSLCGVVAGALAWRGEAAELVRPLVTRCPADSSTWREDGALAVNQALLCYSLLEDVGAAWALVEQLRHVARTRGSVGAEVLAAAHSAMLHGRGGDLANAEADLRRVVELDRDHAVALVVPLALCFAADALVERPDLAAALAPSAGWEIEDETVEGAMLHELRGRLALAHGSAHEARGDLEAAAATYEALHLCSARATSWRCALALAVGQGGDDERERAAELAAAELAEARRFRSERAIGIALCTQGLLEPGARAIDRLEEAVTMLERSQARLAHGRALVELGAALRRGNRRAAARAPLRAGLELAEICGARRLRERALVELHATGARPRRAMLSGPAALTTAERRVAELAVAGLTNPDIARTLFVTINTVEGHLRQVYRKLSIHSRRQLSQALRDDIAA
jgi:DNA-binding CsgD family transcriptional regulator